MLSPQAAGSPELAARGGPARGGVEVVGAAIAGEEQAVVEVADVARGEVKGGERRALREVARLERHTRVVGETAADDPTAVVLVQGRAGRIDDRRDDGVVL